MALTPEERRERADRHIAFIEQQIKMIERDLSNPKARAERDFQRWRQELLRRYGAESEAHLWGRLAALREAIRPEIWAIRHAMGREQARDQDEWQAVCEAVIIEYLLGLYP